MNPITQLLNSKNILSTLSMLKSGNPNTIYQNLLNTNPQFRNFINTNQGKSVEQIASENGIDMSLINNLMK